METKPFWLSSETYVALAAVVAALSGALPVNDSAKSYLATIVAAAYAISRGLAKSGTQPVASTDLAGDPDDTLGGSDHPS